MENIPLQVGVKVLLKNKEGKYLLLRRSLEKYPEVGKDRWDIVGGRITPGTPLLENLRREVREETGLEITGIPRLIFAQDILDTRHIVRLTFLGEADGEIALDGESDKYSWFSMEEMDAISGSINKYFREILSKKIIHDA
jgi:ADP-ribose pyrophosphatase YjhB (NUDIX family)